MGTMLLRQFDELAVQAEVLIDVLYEQLIGQQSRSYCGDMRERRPIGHAMLHADRDGHCRAAAVPTLAVHQQPIRVGQVPGEVEHLSEMRGRRMPLIGDSRDVVHDDIEMTPTTSPLMARSVTIRVGQPSPMRTAASSAPTTFSSNMSPRSLRMPACARPVAPALLSPASVIPSSAR